MIFEGLNCPFGHVVVVVVGGNRFISHAGCLNGPFVLSGCLIVKNLMFGDGTVQAHPCQCLRLGKDEFAAGLIVHCLAPQRVAVEVV